MRRIVFGTVLFASAVGFGGTAWGDCSTIIATTPSGATFPCTVCIEGGRPISAICTPPVTGR